MTPPTQDNLQNLNENMTAKDLLKDECAIITGATDGIGKAISIACSSHGVRLLLLAKNGNKLNSLLEELSQLSE